MQREGMALGQLLLSAGPMSDGERRAYGKAAEVGWRLVVWVVLSSWGLVAARQWRRRASAVACCLAGWQLGQRANVQL